MVCDSSKDLVDEEKCLGGVVPKEGLKVMGKTLRAEVMSLSYLMDKPDGPFVGIVGGEKLSAKVKLIDSLLDKVHKIALTGGVAMTFLAALGKNIGKTK